MTSDYEKNMDIIRLRFPAVAYEMEQCPVPCERRVHDGKKGFRVVQYQRHGVWRNLSSAYEPHAEAHQQTENQHIEESRIIFVLGEASLYHLEATLKRATGNAVVVMISNWPSHLRIALETRDLVPVFEDKRLVLVASTDMTIIAQYLGSIAGSDMFDVPTFTWVEHPLERTLQGETIKEIQKRLHWAFSTSVSNRATVQKFEHWWAHNFTANIQFLLSGTSPVDLKNTWSAKPVIIVGAGPSLNGNIQSLSKAKDHALIVCTDTAFRILQRHGIEPDLIVTVDGSPANAEYFDGVRYHEIPLLMDQYSHRDVTRNHRAEKIVSADGGYHIHWWNKILGTQWDGIWVSEGGSVATTALAFSRLLGADPVILIGVDLSYPRGETYAAGALHAGRTVETLTTREFFEIEDIHGNPILTTRDYFYYLRWFQQAAEQRDRMYVNATEGGALKGGFVLKTLHDAITDHCHDAQPVAEWKENLVSKALDFDKAQRVLRNLKRSQRELKAAVKYCSVIGRALERYVTILKQGDSMDFDDVSRRMDKAREKMNTLEFALAFLDSHSFFTIYRDIKLSEAVENPTEAFSHREIAIQKAELAKALFNDLGDTASISIEMHMAGIKGVERLWS